MRIVRVAMAACVLLAPAAAVTAAITTITAAVTVVTATPAAAAQGNAYLRLAHLSPDTPHVDVYVSSAAEPSRNFTVKGVGYGAMSGYQVLPTDTYTISMRAAGAPADSPPVIGTTVNAASGAAYTVAGMGRYAELALRVLDDDLSMPASGNARMRVIQASTASPTLDVSVEGGGAVATGVAFGQASDYSELAAGDVTLVAGTPGQQPASTLPVELAPSGVYTTLLVDKNGALATELHTDAIGAKVVPAGGVETGLGGASAPTPASRLALALLITAAAAAGALVVTARRYGRA